MRFRTIPVFTPAALACGLPRDPESTLERTALQNGDLDLVIAGSAGGSPWAAKASLTRPYYVDTTTVNGERAEVPHVAVPPGENAWQVDVERAIEFRKIELAALRHTAAR